MKRLRTIIIVLILALIVGLTSIVTIYTDLLWFDVLGYQSVYIKIISAKLITGFVFAAFFWVFFAANVLLARRLAPRLYYLSPRLSFRAIIQQFKPFMDKYFPAVFLAVSLTLAFIIGLAMSSRWEIWLKYFSQAPAGVRDPIFNRQIGFYFFSMPVLENLQAYFFAVILITAIVSIAVHLFDGAIVPGSNGDTFAPHVKAHLSWLATLLALDLAGYWFFRLYNLLYAPTGKVVFGASYTDIHAVMPALRILVFITVIAAVIFLINIYFRGWRLPIAAITLIAVTWLLAGNIYPALVQAYGVAPNEIVRERPYIKKNIAFTRKAYDLDKIKESKFPALETLDLAGLDRNQETIGNVRLWDWRPLARTYGQIQEIRLYYGFFDVDLDRYIVDDQYRQVTLSARELSIEKLPDTARTWINEHLVFTHGYGAVMSPVNEATDEGLPTLWLKNIPPVAATNIELTRPQIYYGEETNDYIITNTKTKEFDYPKGDKNQYTVYSGTGGISVTSLTKAAFAYRFSSLKLLLSDAVSGDSKIHFRRNIVDRVKRIAPFLQYDNDPYLVIIDGKLYWFIDAYTSSDRYPYSQPYNGRDNYIRNSVKVVIDAYNGDTDFFIIDKDDPVANTYKAIFPKLFKPFDKMPPEFKKHLRYPETLFTIQANMFTVFHMRDPQVFYNKEDMWSIPEEIAESGRAPMMPYYVIMKLPGEDHEEFLLLQPFTPRNKNNMIAWLAARSDMPDYGEMKVFNFPKDRLIFGPLQISARIDQDPEISRQLSLWNQRGSRVIRGNLLVIPIEESIIYIQPLYLQSEQSDLPELKRVLAAYGSRVAMEPTLDKALQSVFAGIAPAVEEEEGKEEPKKPGEKKSAAELVSEAEQRFNAAQEAAKNGDWAKYGEELKVLGEILGELSEREGK